MAPQDLASDRSFGPQYGPKFDLTLHFQEIIFTFIPSIIAIALSPLCIWVASRDSHTILISLLFWCKLAFSLGIVGVDAAILGAWVHSPAHSTDTSTAAAALSFAASVSISVVILYIHLRSLRSSSLASVYLSATMLFDMMKTRSYYMRDGMHHLAALSVASAAIKFCLILTEEFSKRRMIADKDLQKSVGAEALSGFWNRSLFLWINALLFSGYRRILTYADLGNLAPEFGSEKLYREFDVTWKSTTRSKHCLVKACFRAYYVPFLLIFLPELCQSAFTLLKPLFLRRAIEVVGEEITADEVKDGLIGAAVIIFFGFAIANAMATHWQYRLAAKLRGAIIMLLFRKSLTLTHANAKESAAISLMSTDIDGIVEGIPQIHKIITGLLEACIGVYILTAFVSAASAIAVGSIIFSAVTAVIFGKFIVRLQARWNEKIQVRVAKTSDALSQLKNIKMLGLAPAASNYIKQLHIEELERFKTFRYLKMYFVMNVVFMDIMTPVFVIAGAYFSPIWNRHLDTAETFGTLLVLAIITYPLMTVMSAYSTVSSTMACFLRIQAYLVAPDAVDSRRIRQTGFATPSDPSEKSTVHGAPKSPNSPNSDSEQSPEQVAVEFSGASISATVTGAQILKNLFLSFAQSTFSVILGSTGAGKTIFLRSILGEAGLIIESEGYLRVDDVSIAYCGQTTWIRNESIRSNILGGLPYEKALYEAVIHACLLKEDFQQLPNGDLTIAGDNGNRLSGGQKHRIALARALYSRARILVLDDVLSALDKKTGKTLFARVFGPDGLIKRSKSTVFLATHSIDYVKGADQVVLIDGQGQVTSRHHLDGSNLAQSLLQELSKGDTEDANKAEKHLEDDMLPPSDESQETKPPQQTGDFSLYTYYFSSVPKFLIVSWLFTLFLTTLSEVSGEIYIRGWLAVGPNDAKYFIGYALVCASSSFISSSQALIYYLRIIPIAAQRLHETLLNTVVAGRLDSLASNNQASIVNRFSQDITLITDELPVKLFSTSYLFSFMILKGIIVAVGMKYTAPIVIASFVFVYLLGAYYLRASRQIRFLDLEARAPLFGEFTETASGLEHIRAFGWQEQVMKRAFKALDHSQKPFYYMFAIQRWLLLGLDLLTLVLTVVVVAVAMYTKGHVSQEGFGLSLLMAIQINSALTGVINSFAAFETALGAVSRLRLFAENTPLEKPSTDAVELPNDWPQRGEVKFENVTALYQTSRDTKTALENVSVEIFGGETVAVIGRTGSGKSSMILTLLNFLDYTGSITIDGIDISRVPHEELRSRITTLSQEPVILHGTIRGNLLPYEGQQGGSITDETVMGVLKQVCLSDHVMNHGGLNAPRAKMGFSHGQEQLLSMARAILHGTHYRTKLVLMDEPTSNVDVETDAIIQRLITESFGESTVLVVSHRAEAIQGVDAFLEVSEGKVSRLKEKAD